MHVRLRATNTCTGTLYGRGPYVLIIRDLGIIFRKAITRRFGKTFRVAHFTLKLVYKLLEVQLKMHVYIGLTEEENPPTCNLSI